MNSNGSTLVLSRSGENIPVLRYPRQQMIVVAASHDHPPRWNKNPGKAPPPNERDLIILACARHLLGSFAKYRFIPAYAAFNLPRHRCRVSGEPDFPFASHTCHRTFESGRHLAANSCSVLVPVPGPTKYREFDVQPAVRALRRVVFTAPRGVSLGRLHQFFPLCGCPFAGAACFCKFTHRPFLFAESESNVWPLASPYILNTIIFCSVISRIVHGMPPTP